MKRQVKKNNSFEKLSSDDDDEKVDAEPTKKPMRKIKKKIRNHQKKFNIDDENMLDIYGLCIAMDKIKKKNKEKKEKEKREEERQKKNKSIIKNLKHKNHILREENKEFKKTIEHLEEKRRRQEEQRREEEERRRQEEQRREEEERRRTKKAKNKKSNFPKDINDFENNPTKQQWYVLSKKYHPDKGGSKQFMQKINDIWAEHKIRYDSN